MVNYDTNVDYSDSRTAELNSVAWVLTGAATVAVGLKLYSRLDKKLAGWDDFFIFWSMAISIIGSALTTYSASLRLGRHTAAVVSEYGMDALSKALFWQQIGYPFNIGSYSFPNISIAILIDHLLEPNPTRARWLYGMVIFQVIFALISVFLVFFQCNPTSLLWDSRVAGTCWNPAIFLNFSYAVGGYTAVTDIVLAVVPIASFWNLQMRRSTKISVSIMMGLTLLSAVLTAVKTAYLKLFIDHSDPLWNVIPLILLGLTESNVVIIAACAPTLRPFFRKIITGAKSSSARNTSRLQSGSDLKLTVRSGGSKKSTKYRVKDPEAGASGENLNADNHGIWLSTEVIVESDAEANSIFYIEPHPR
ncbi:hypothetical protein N7468_008192 [Penicillium chermesinum]|uniref:Rhodopsin domain-containing protein n=1 Tax=Penicillium chermesinum TaxID=63820 RepID=A0A9W9NPG0_9EURO|nr:uncharacterized protein N7468_008192 [Penicillium chermesinum]KAJ5223650.1 hypothetical protein N7468_008192 [Penicillium chermesinum]